MVLIGCTPPGRHIEQHDVFFGIGHSLKELIPDMIGFWPEAQGKLHIDAFREVNFVDGFQVQVVTADNADRVAETADRLFFLNLGGYKKNEFEEYHYKMLAVCRDMGMAARLAKQTAFYKHTGFKHAESHIDDKYGVDVDDIHPVEDILPATVKSRYKIRLSLLSAPAEDELQIGYFKLSKL